MSYDSIEIFIFASEGKDLQCLSPIKDSLSVSGCQVYITALPHSRDIYEIFDRDAYRKFANSPHPIAVFSSSWVIESLLLVRAPDTFHSVNIEHGVAPFKNYTFGSHLLIAENYIAPTQLWAERLRQLYPDRAERVSLGGFPRLEVLRELRAAALSDNNLSKTCDPRLAKWMAADGQRKLVILTWGTNADELDKLPDHENIAYLYHPADGSGLAARTARRCSLFLSTAELTTQLLCAADKVFGDFSSLTLEALALGIQTYIFIERRFYLSNCDLGEAFFDRGSGAFGQIPETPYSLDALRVLDGSQLAKALYEDADPLPPFSAADLPSGILPPDDRDNRLLTADLICEIAKTPPDAAATELIPPHRFESVMFLLDCYLQILGRPADLKGLQHYLSKLETDARPRPVVALEIMSALAKSEEARRRFSKWEWCYPKIELLAQQTATVPNPS